MTVNYIADEAEVEAIRLEPSNSQAVALEGAIRVLQAYLGEHQKLVITREGANIYGIDKRQSMDTTGNIAEWLVENKASE